MIKSLTHVALVVHDYDDAIDYFRLKLGFELVEDTPLSPHKRWVVVAPPGGQCASILLAKASSPGQSAAVGRQTGGRVFLFLQSTDFDEDYKTLKRRGVKFTEEPRNESYGRVVVFEDLYGNKWDLIQPHPCQQRTER